MKFLLFTATERGLACFSSNRLISILSFLDKTKEQKHPPWRHLTRKWTKFISVENINKIKTSAVEIVGQEIRKIH